LNLIDLLTLSKIEEEERKQHARLLRLLSQSDNVSPRRKNHTPNNFDLLNAIGVVESAASTPCFADRDALGDPTEKRHA
jgi:hypothetical protein